MRSVPNSSLGGEETGTPGPYSDFPEEYLHIPGLSLDQARGFLRPTLDALAWPRDAQVLDVGGGNGALAAVLADAGCEATLLEVSPQNVEYARRETSRILTPEAFGRMHFVVGDLTGNESSLAIRELGEKFDLIVSRSVWEHLTPAQCLNMAESFGGLLKPGGCAYIETTPTLPLADVLRWCRKRLLGVGGGYKETGIHINEQSYRSFKTALAAVSWTTFSVIPVVYNGWLYGQACGDLKSRRTRVVLPIVWCLSRVLDGLACLPVLRNHLNYGLAGVSRRLGGAEAPTIGT